MWGECLVENGVWRDTQFYEMYFIDADANALVFGHPNWNAQSK